jgi:diketogulonate reductase-like aldo/keto reductase
MVVQGAKEETMVKKTVCFGEQAAVPAIGLGTWYMGENAAQRQQEVAALRAGIDHGLTVIDTAEMYADGGAEEVVGQAIRGLRDRVVLVSKVYPWHAGGAAMRRACENSLRRLQTDYLDMYLLHWRGDIPLRRRSRRWKGWWPRANPPLGRLQSGHRRYAGAVADGGWRTLRHQSGALSSRVAGH